MANLCKHIKDCFCLETESLLWGLICTTAVFSYSNNMVDAYISSKWYFTLLALCFSVTFLSIWNILHNKFPPTNKPTKSWKRFQNNGKVKLMPKTMKQKESTWRCFPKFRHILIIYRLTEEL